MKSSRKRPLQLATATTFGITHLNQHFNETAHYAKGWLTQATESEAESESEAQGALRSSVNQKSESEAESEA